MHSAARLLARGGLLLLLNAAVGLCALLWLGRGMALQPWETDSIFEGNRLDEAYDYVLLGTSRAYLLSRYEANHKALETGLGANVLNLALPTAGGIKPGVAYLEHVLDQGVQPRAVILCLDPFVLFNEACNENHKFVYFEAFRLDFLLRLIREDFSWRRLLIYVRHKFTMEWIRRTPAPLPRFDNALTELPSADRIALRMDSLYLEGMNEAAFARYQGYVERLLLRCKAEGIAVHVVMMPTLLGPEPGQPAVDELLERLQQRYAFARNDWTDAMRRPEWFYDLDHLNATGVEQVVDQLFKPLLNAPPSAPL